MSLGSDVMRLARRLAYWVRFRSQQDDLREELELHREMMQEDFERQFRTLESLRCDLFLGAHGAYFDMEAKYARMKAGTQDAFVDPTGCAAFIADRKQAFQKELAKQKG